MESDAAPLAFPDPESNPKQTESQQKSARPYTDSQQGRATNNSNLLTSTQSNQQNSSSLCSFQSSDIAAMAALTVQVFAGQMHFRPAEDTGYWRSQAPTLPAAAQQFVLACLAEPPVSMQKLMKDSFFTAEVRAAADYLNTLEAVVNSQQQAAETHIQPSGVRERPQNTSRHACALQAMLAGPLDLKTLAKGGAMQLCMQSIIRIVTDVARVDSPSGAAASAVQQDSHLPQSTGALVAEVLLRLVMLSARSLAIQGPLQVWAALLGSRAPCGLPTGPGKNAAHVELQAQLMQANRLKQLVAGVGLSAYVDIVHSALLSAVCGGASDAEEPAAAQLTQHAIQVCANCPKQDLSLPTWQAWRTAHHSNNSHQYRTLCVDSFC